MKIASIILTAMFFAGSPLHAQLVADGATATLANVTNAITGTVTVGTNGAFTSLVLGDNALLTNSAHGVIGRNATAQSNEVQLLSPSARWRMGNNLFVGSNGAFNRLVVSNGAFLNDNSGFLGNGASSSNNFVLVTGSGSFWTNRSDLRVGVSGRDNLMVISNGARVVSFGGELGSQPGSSNNLVVVTGSGSVWTNVLGGWVSVGGGERGNRLIIETGGQVGGDNGVVGTGSFGGDSEALVTGPGSLWSSRGDAVVGLNPSNNRLVVSNGAAVLAGNHGRLGAVTGSTNNVVLVTGAGSLWSNQFELYVGEAGPGNRVEVNNGGWMVSSNTYIGFGSASNVALVTGAGSTLSNRANLVIGNSRGNNRLVISNGATVRALVGELGSTAGSGTNEAVVTGPGSAWRTEEGVVVGRGGAGNRLRIADGATVSSSSGFVGHSAANNEAFLNGPGAIWTNQLDFYVGFFSSGNRLAISNGATLHANDSSYLGYNPGSAGNTATISGPGSVWRSASRLVVGDFGAGNRLTATDGAALIIGGPGVIGVTSGSSNNNVIVALPGTRLTVGSNFFVGSNGAFNVMQLATGASASVGGDTHVGAGTNGNNNTLDVSNAGSVWTNHGDLLIGGGGPGRNLLLVRNGGVARGFSDGYVGVGGPLNEVIVRDPGSLWDLPFGTVSVGVYDAGNLMTVRDGGVVRSALGELGRFTLGSNALVTVTGAGSLWQITGPLSVGASGPRSRLVIDSGGAVVTSSGVFVGAQPSSIHNRVMVSGGVLQATNPSLSAVLDVRRGTNALNAGLIDVDRLLLTNAQGFFEFNGGTLITRGATISNGVDFVVGGSGSSPATWDVRAGPTNTFVSPNIYVGNNSAFNRIVLTNGARLTNENVVIVGFGAGGNSNLVLLSGAGTRWSTPSVLEVGVIGGSGNRLVISNGAGMTSHFNNSIGWNGSSNNEVTVTGPGSFWDRRNSSGMLIFCGNGGQNNRLIVTNGGLVASGHGFIGTLAAPCSNNYAVVTGAGSTWSNLFEIRVGDAGSASQLFVEDNGVVRSGLSCYVGFSPGSINNRLAINNATLLVTNAAADGLLEIRRGTNLLNAGLIEADILRMTNGTLSKFEFNGGTLSVRSSRVSVGNPVIVGNGVSSATLNLTGNGTHDFSGTLGLIVTNNATLTGNGSLLVQLQVRAGATLSPGASIGKISVSTAPFLSGATLMEISKDGAALTNDQFQVTGTLTYGGSLIVSKLGPTAFAAGDRFPLFSATTYAGTFASITLPPLPAPLSWTNKLLVDGSIEVIAPLAIAMSSGSYTQSFDSLSMSGSSNPWRDNSTLPGWYAAKVVAPSAITNYIASDGSSLAGALYSFGSTGDGERALGSIGSDTVGDISYGLGFINDTATTADNFNITFTGEQWRSSSSLNANTLTFWYRVSPAPITDPEPGVTNNWTQVTGLNFVSPVLLGTGVPLDGNQPTNRQTFTSVLIPGLAVAPGESVFFRWRDVNDTGTDQGLAVDDLVVSFSALPPQIVSLAFSPTNGFAQIFGRGESNVTYGVEAATNLFSPIFWQRIGSNTADAAGMFQFADTNAPPFPMRFYRMLFP